MAQRFQSLISTRGDGGPAEFALQLELRPGDCVGPFRFLHWLGRGSMGAVAVAHDPRLDRRVALKMLHPGDADPNRLLIEARAMARVRHASVVTVYETGIADERPYLVMEYIRGGNLRQWLADARAAHKPWREVVATLRKAGEGLQAAHRSGLVHRDFKPENILVEGDRVLVADFGLVNRCERENERTLDGEGDDLERTVHGYRCAGTPAYMAPEQHLGEPTDPRADQFAFCVTLYEALYGVRPFQGSTAMELSAEVVCGDVTPATDSPVPRAVFEVIARGLRRRAQDRYGSMTDLLEALDQACAPGRRWRALPALAYAAAGSMAAMVATMLGS